MLISARFLLAVVIANLAYRSVVILQVGSDHPAANLDLFALPAIVSTVWLVQLFVNFPSLRRLRREPGSRFGIPSEGLLAVLLAVVVGSSWYGLGTGVYRLITGQPVDIGGLTAAFSGGLIAAVAWSLIFLIPSVRKGGIWIGENDRRDHQRE